MSRRRLVKWLHWLAFGLILSVVGRATPEEKRSQALALTAAFGSLGQMVLPALSGAGGGIAGIISKAGLLYAIDVTNDLIG